MQFRWMAPQKNGPEQYFELGQDAFFRPPSSFFSEIALSDALEEHDGKVSIDGRTNYYQTANDINTFA